MKGKSADIEAREAAFQCYRESGGNKELTLRKLTEKGYSISKPTLYDWVKKFNFDSRLANADVKAQETKDAATTTEAQLLADLLKQKEKYEKHFENLGSGIDNQAQYAYQGLIKTIVEIKARIGAAKADIYLDVMKDFIEFLVKADPEGLGIIDRNLDKFDAFVKERYGA